MKAPYSIVDGVHEHIVHKREIERARRKALERIAHMNAARAHHEREIMELLQEIRSMLRLPHGSMPQSR